MNNMSGLTWYQNFIDGSSVAYCLHQSDPNFCDFFDWFECDLQELLAWWKKKRTIICHISTSISLHFWIFIQGVPDQWCSCLHLDLDATDFVILPPSSIYDNHGIQSLGSIKYKCCPKWSTFCPDETIILITNDGIDCLFAGKLDLLSLGWCAAGFEVDIVRGIEPWDMSSQEYNLRTLYCSNLWFHSVRRQVRRRQSYFVAGRYMWFRNSCYNTSADTCDYQVKMHSEVYW